MAMDEAVEWREERARWTRAPWWPLVAGMGPPRWLVMRPSTVTYARERRVWGGRRRGGGKGGDGEVGAGVGATDGSSLEGAARGS